VVLPRYCCVPTPDALRSPGFSVFRTPAQVRARIGLAGQHAAVDEILSGRQNLVMFGRLYHLPVHVARRRADELLGQFRLAEVGGKPVRQYSGGMRGLPEDLARPAHLAGYARNHWGIGNREHYVRTRRSAKTSSGFAPGTSRTPTPPSAT
jgi:hypothetical protein